MKKDSLPIGSVLSIFQLVKLFMKEQFKEPIAVFWIVLSPCALFYLWSAPGAVSEVAHEFNYIEASAFFYAYVCLSVALFGFALYIVGRRESGFMRSFIYTVPARKVFLLAQFIAYSLIAILYVTVFYLFTKPAYGTYVLYEYLTLIYRSMLCYVAFCIPALLSTLVPLSFQNFHTSISIASFCLLILGVIESRHYSLWVSSINSLNPLAVARHVLVSGLENEFLIVSLILLVFILNFWIVLRLLRINPVWSRY